MVGAVVLSGCGPRRVGGSPALAGVDVGGKASLKEHAANARLLFGFAVDTRQLRENRRYREVVEQQASIIVAENAMKWRALRPAVDRYDFEDADGLLTFAEKNRIKLRGHNLCWHESLPVWFDAVANRGNAHRLLVDHIRTVAGRYAGRMHSWDVVNEAINTRDGRGDGLRNSPWLRLVGTDYIEIAFRTAREADPAALLTYNEFGLEPETVEGAGKRAATLQMLRRLKQRNVPIDAVGIQSHLEAGSRSGYGPELTKFMAACREMGLEIFLSEMDVSDRNLPVNTDSRDAVVAESYRSYLEMTLQERRVTAVLTWGVDDGGTWLTAGEPRRDQSAQRPLLFDSSFQAKPAFAAVREAFVGRMRPGSGASAARVPAYLPRL
ncbi:beta-1,4-xylanase [Terriglobus roseus DSM 18391]|uniref:Beta-xylanase n=2 Tax=Terriglobus roseus TaxID=392734 RepID=I3ZFY1_TERRK|nr:beta-1,4-xylanase [Terriglobus roseus DSM 18391]